MATDAQRRTELSRDRVVTTAIELLDRHGLSGLSMRRLAEELGVGTMSLYHYVADKADLAEAIVRRVLDDLPLPAAGQPWASAARDLCWTLRRQAHTHPAAFELVLLNDRPGASARLRGATSAALEGAGLEPDQARAVRRALSRFVMGWCIAELSEHPRSTSGPRQQQGDADFAFALDALLGGLQARLEDR